MKTHQDEQKELLWTYLENTHFKDWKTPRFEGDLDHSHKLYDNLEFQLKPRCNLNCTYCYYNDRSGHGKELHPSELADTKTLLKNAEIMFNFLSKNNYYPAVFELFGGEIFLQPSTFKIFDMVFDFYKNTDKKPDIVVPTNFGWIRSNTITEKVVNIGKRAKEAGIHFGLSASFDGKYMDHVNRPYINTLDQHDYYTDEFYDKIFEYSKQYGCGFHPMIHYDNIENAFKNFMWFQEKFEEFGINWNNIYLLEVRNKGWTKKTVNLYIDFYKKVLEFAYNKLNRNPETFILGFVFGGYGDKASCNVSRMNMFNNIGKIGRGIGCSLQTTMQLRLSDLAATPCHRQSYDSFNGFKFIHDGENIIDIEPKNVEYYIGTMTTDHTNWPYCVSCGIKEICLGGCMGAQYEATGDPFLPDPSVCLLEFGKVKAQIEFLSEHGLFEFFVNFLSLEQAVSYKKIKKTLGE